jgi:hypothetical protein
MSWFEILLNKDQIRAGELKKFQQAFRDAFHAAGLPREMGLFAGIPHNNGEHPFYLTPGCSRFAENFISYYSGTPCEKPKKSGFEPSLLIGFHKAWDLLLE